MDSLHAAYGVLQSQSALWLNPKYKEQLESNYLKAKPLAEAGDAVQAIAQLIEGVFVESLYCELDDGRIIDPFGLYNSASDRAIRVSFDLEGEAVIELPHFDNAKALEWEGLFQMRPLLLSRPKLKLDLRGNRGFSLELIEAFQNKFLNGYSGKVKVTVNETVKGSALKLANLLDERPSTQIDGKLPQPLEPYLDPIHCILPMGASFTFPRQSPK